MLKQRDRAPFRFNRNGAALQVYDDMDFEFTDDQKALQALVRKFVEKEMPKDHGTEAHKREFLPKIASGECHLALSMTKPDSGMRVMAGYGFTMDYHMQRYYRDIRQLIFAPITNEMNRNFIAQVGCGLPKSY